MTAALVILATLLAGVVPTAIVMAVRIGDARAARQLAEALAADTARAFASYREVAKRQTEAQHETITALERALTAGDSRAALAGLVRVRQQATDRDALDRVATVLADAATTRAADGAREAVRSGRGLLGRLLRGAGRSVDGPSASVDAGGSTELPGGE